MRFFKFDVDIINTHQIKIFIFDDFKNNKINNSFNFLYNFINSYYFISLNYLRVDNIYNKRINFNHIYEIYNIIINQTIDFIFI